MLNCYLHSPEGDRPGEKYVADRRPQMAADSLGPNTDHRYEVAGRLTEEERQWFQENYPLLFEAVSRSVYCRMQLVNPVDMADMLLPNAIYAYRKWEDGHGASRTTLIFNQVRQCAGQKDAIVPKMRWFKGKGGKVRPLNPILFGDFEPVAYVEPDDSDHTPEWDLIMDCFASLKPAHRKVLDRYLGLTRLPMTVREIAAEDGCSYQNIEQKIDRALSRLREWYLAKAS